MTLKLLIILLVGFTIIFILRARMKLAMLAEQIRALRAHALADITYRKISDAEMGEALATATAEAEGLGLRMLGDYVEETQVNPLQKAMRWFVDGEGTTFGWMAPFDVEGARHIVLVLMSHELDRQVLTTRQPRASTLARPPFAELHQIAVATSMKDTLAKHRVHAGLDDAERGFIPVKTFEQLERELDRMRGKVTEWRKEQPAAELLDADLRALLGAQYERLAVPLKRRLA